MHLLALALAPTRLHPRGWILVSRVRFGLPWGPGLVSCLSWRGGKGEAAGPRRRAAWGVDARTRMLFGLASTTTTSTFPFLCPLPHMPHTQHIHHTNTNDKRGDTDLMAWARRAGVVRGSGQHPLWASTEPACFQQHERNPHLHTSPAHTHNHRMAFAASRMLKRGLTSFKGAARASTPAAFCK